MSIFRGIAGALGGNSGSRVIQSIIERLRNKSQPATVGRDPNYKPPTEQINTQPGTSNANSSLYEQGLLVPDSQRMSTRQGMTNFTLSTGRRFEPLSNLNTRQDIAPRQLTSFQEKVLMNPDKNSVDISNQLTNVPPQPSSLVQPFAQPVQQSANQIFGDLFARQNAVGAPMMFKINK